MRPSPSPGTTATTASSGARGDADDLVREQRVHVDLRDGRISDDEHAVGAELEHLLTDLLDRTRWARDEALDVVRAGPARDLVVAGIEPHARRADRAGHRARHEAALERGERAVDEQPQPARARVDHARGLVHRVLVHRAVDGGAALVDGNAQQLLRIALRAIDGLVHLLQRGQHRAVRRLRDRGEGVFAAKPERLLDVDPVVGGRVLDPPDDLAEQHAAVAARTHQGAVRGAGEDGGRLWFGLAGVLERGLHRVEHVRARVAVGDRVDVERVDLVDVGFEPRRRGFERGKERRGVTACYDGRTLPVRDTVAERFR
jgi:hypothetical protein